MFFLRTFFPFLIGFLLAHWTSDAVKIPCAVLISPKFGYRCADFTLFGYIFSNRDGKWSGSRGRFSIVNTYHVMLDLDKPFREDYNRRGFISSLIADIILTAVTAVVIVLCWNSAAAILSGKFEFIDATLALYAVMLGIRCISSYCITIYSFCVASKRLGGYIDSKLNMLRAGASFAELDMRPFEELPYKKCTQAEEVLYKTVYAFYLLGLGRIDEMAAPIHELTAYLRCRDFSVNNILALMLLIFWYSRYEINAEVAAQFYNKTASAFANDTDPNTRRVMAYYAYGIERDDSKARFFLEQARSGLGDWKGSAAEKQLELRLIDELDGFLRNEGF